MARGPCWATMGPLLLLVCCGTVATLLVVAVALVRGCSTRVRWPWLSFGERGSPHNLVVHRLTPVPMSHRMVLRRACHRLSPQPHVLFFVAVRVSWFVAVVIVLWRGAVCV